MPQPKGLFPSNAALPLMTDLYELTMAAGYFITGKRDRAAFEAYVRTLPLNRSFLVAAGLEQALQYILNLRFNEEAIRWLRSLPPFAQLPGAFFDYLRTFQFQGDVWAVPEGTVVFANEPLVRVEADLIEAQILETYLLTCLNLQTLVATKARGSTSRQRAGRWWISAPGGRTAHRRGCWRRGAHHRRLCGHQQRGSGPGAGGAAVGDDGALVDHGLWR